MANPNIYQVLVDTGKDYANWVQEAPNPSSAIKKVLSKVNYGKSPNWTHFDVGATLLVKNMTYAEYRAKHPATEKAK